MKLLSIPSNGSVSSRRLHDRVSSTAENADEFDTCTVELNAGALYNLLQRLEASFAYCGERTITTAQALPSAAEGAKLPAVGRYERFTRNPIFRLFISLPCHVPTVVRRAACRYWAPRRQAALSFRSLKLGAQSLDIFG